jgi:hypothetical protein
MQTTTKPRPAASNSTSTGKPQILLSSIGPVRPSSFAICEATLQVRAAAEVNLAFALVGIIPNELRNITARSYGRPG